MSWLDWFLPNRRLSRPAPEVQEAMKKRDVAISSAVRAVKEVDRLNVLMDEYERAERRLARRRR